MSVRLGGGEMHRGRRTPLQELTFGHTSGSAVLVRGRNLIPMTGAGPGFRNGGPHVIGEVYGSLVEQWAQWLDEYALLAGRAQFGGDFFPVPAARCQRTQMTLLRKLRRGSTPIGGERWFHATLEMTGIRGRVAAPELVLFSVGRGALLVYGFNLPALREDEEPDAAGVLSPAAVLSRADAIALAAWLS
ncbi:hypothetical protein [Streptacidiphilus sp. EB103A]|uniref:hypothetical protein n=1 Tax=Streptacidiphilus sp. EB103A TaxID=3156275 RepID=UPI003514FCD4